MEIIDVAKRINDKILLLEKGRGELRSRSISAAETTAEYEKQMAITLLKLENGVIDSWEGYDCKGIAKSNMDKIARGICWQARLNMDKADKEYRLTVVKLDTIKSELNGLQSINRYLQEDIGE